MDVDSQHYDAAIIGAGISGLIAAWKLSVAGWRVIVLEKSHVPGGVISSGNADGFLVEHGPNSFLATPEMMETIRELDIAGRLLTRAVKTTDRYLWNRGKLHKVTDNPRQLLMGSFLTTGQKISVLRRAIKPFPPPKTDISVGQYFRRHTSDAFVDLVLGPALNGIYATPADNLSFEAIMPGLFRQAGVHPTLFTALRELKKSRKVGPVSGAPFERQLANFDGGMQVLPDAAFSAAKSHGAHFRFDIEIEGINFAPGIPGNGSPSRVGASDYAIGIRNSGQIVSRHVIITCPAVQAARLLTPIASDSAGLLGKILGVPLTTIAVGFPEDQASETRDGFGFLAARDHGIRCLGAIWNDRMFPGRAPGVQRLITMFYGGQGDREVLDANDETLRQWIASDLQLAMGVSPDAVSFFHATRYNSAIPWFQPGHVENLRDAMRDLPANVHLLGNYLDGVSIPARVKNANALAERLVNELVKSSTK